MFRKGLFNKLLINSSLKLALRLKEVEKFLTTKWSIESYILKTWILWNIK